MIVYRFQTCPVGTRPALADLADRVNRLSRTAAAPSYDDLVSVLIDCAEIAVGIVDVVSGERDAHSPRVAAVEQAVRAAAGAVTAGWRGEAATAPRHLARCRRALGGLLATPLPDGIVRRPSEGFAYYGVSPELYVEAAADLVTELRPVSATVIGIRSIGMALGGVVAAALERSGVASRFYTVRPRGHPFARRTELDAALEAAWRSDRGSHFIVVDEGPGLSGTSMSSVAGTLSRLGVQDERIVFVPSWDPDTDAFVSADARFRWRRHRRFPARFESVWLDSGRLARAWSASLIDDVSAGRWRDHGKVPHGYETAVHPQHERRKYLVARDGERAWIKFAGLGPYGARVHLRAEHLAQAHWSPPSRDIGGGWTAMPLLAGERAAPATADAAALRRLGSYLAWVRRSFETAGPPLPAAIAEMALHNVQEILGEPAARHIEDLQQAAGDGRAVYLDGRMLPHEWVHTEHGLLKTDAAEHHDDHFFPGPCDIAWDVAATIEEWRLDTEAASHLVAVYASASTDADIERRLPFYRAAYLAFRSGYTASAASQLAGTADGRRFRNEAAWYRGRLAAALDPPP